MNDRRTSIAAFNKSQIQKNPSGVHFYLAVLFVFAARRETFVCCRLFAPGRKLRKEKPQSRTLPKSPASH
jgi:hypothetical protein